MTRTGREIRRVTQNKSARKMVTRKYKPNDVTRRVSSIEWNYESGTERAKPRGTQREKIEIVV